MNMISLGKPMKECCPEPSGESSKEMHYPTLYIDAYGMDLGDIPTEGMAMIKFKVVRDSKTVSTYNGETKKNRSLELEVHGIKPMDEDTEEESEESLDKLRLELTGE